MGSEVIWFGPVSSMQVRGATLEGVTPKFVSCTGDGSDGHATCADRAESWKDADGRRLPALFRKLEIAAEETDTLYLGAFSAGGQSIKRIGLHPDDRAITSAVLLADGTYTIEWLNQKEGITKPIEGFLRYAVDFVADGRLFLATASSSPNHAYPTGAESLNGLRLGIEKELGREFDDITTDPLWSDLTAPVRAWRMNNVIFADFGAAYKHGEHATHLAPMLWPRAIAAAAPCPG